jgi:hypothetical protein
MARPRKALNEVLLEKLAQSGCSADQIAAILDCERSTIERRYAATLKKGREHARGRLQVKLFQEALNGNTAALIFLAKNWLGMRDNPQMVVSVTQNDTGAAALEPALSPEQLADLERVYSGIQKRALLRAKRELEEEEWNSPPRNLKNAVVELLG